MRPKAELRARLEALAETDPALDILLRLRAVAPDPDGRHVLMWLDPKVAGDSHAERERRAATVH